MAYATLANKGVRKPLSILKLNQAPAGEQLISRKDAEAVMEMLEKVTLPGGTGVKAAVPGYRVGGKTGTSRVAVAGGYGDDYVGLFAGYAPVSNPLARSITLRSSRVERALSSSSRSA